MSDTCPFCAIVRGDLPADIVAESDNILAFKPLHPATDGHTLVIPKAHFRDFLGMPSSVAESVFVFATRLGEFLRAQYDCEGMNLITSAGAAATQTIFHVHVHLVPRWLGDGMGPIWPKQEAA